MQRCLKCGRTYESDTQKFCTHDGGRLTTELPSASSQAPTTYDLNQTVRTDPFDPEATVTRMPEMPDMNRTVASAPTSEIRSKETGPATPPPSAPIYPQPSSPQPPPPPPAQPEQPRTVAFNQSTPTPPAPQQPQQYYQPPPSPQAPPPAQQPPMQQQQYAPAPHQHQPPQHQQPQQQVAQAPAKVRKSSKAPLIIGLVVILLVGGAAAWYFLIYKKQNATTTSANTNASNTNASANTNSNVGANENANTTANANTNTNTAEPPPPPNSTKFVNSKANLDGKLAEKYSDFSFYYPNTWTRDPKSGVPGASNFVRVERMLPPDFTQENFTVSWYDSQGTLEADQEKVFPKLIESLKARLSKSYQDFKVLSEGGVTINALNGYELRFQSVSKGTEKGDITLWGWVVFLPPGKEGETNGLQLLMLTTSLAPEITSAQDVGVKGELPMILNSFKTGSK